MDRFETAARTYCKLAGIDPDERVGHSVPGSGAYHLSPRWSLLVSEFRDLELRMLALQAAQQLEPDAAIAAQRKEG